MLFLENIPGTLGFYKGASVVLALEPIQRVPLGIWGWKLFSGSLPLGSHVRGKGEWTREGHPCRDPRSETPPGVTSPAGSVTSGSRDR